MPSQGQRMPQDRCRPSPLSGEGEHCTHREQVGLQFSSQDFPLRSNGDASFQCLLEALSKKFHELARRNSLLLKDVQFLAEKCNLSGEKLRSSLLSNVDQDRTASSWAVPDDCIDAFTFRPCRESPVSEADAASVSTRNSRPPSPSASAFRSPVDTSIRNTTDSANKGSSPTRLSDPQAMTLSSTLSTKMDHLFPAWYDPEVDSDRCKHPLGDVMHLVTKGQVAKEGSAQQAKCVMSPVGPFRLFWDFSAMLCLLYEFWSVPLTLVFIAAKRVPFAMVALDWVLVGFFSIDIVLNFFTGYLVADRIVWNPRLIAKHYLREWFLVDAVATVPWDKVFDVMTTAGGDYSAISLVRIVKIAKTIKIIRFVRLAHATRIARFTDVGDNVHEIYAVCSMVLNASKVLGVFVLTAHMTGSMWAAAQPDWKATADLQDAFRMYYHSVWWAFMALTAGSAGSLTHSGSDRPILWTLDIFVACEKFTLIVWLLAHTWLRFAVNFQDQVRMSKAKADATNYLRKRDVSVATQIQVLFSIWETGRARMMRDRFEDIILGDLPTELQRTVCQELWAGPLLSLGLIMHVSHWHEDLVAELALVAKEEVFASKSILFQEANAAIAAYYIMNGSISVFSTMSENPIPDFTKGMWLGEKALVNPMLRRSATAVCNIMSTVMCIHGESFQNVLASLGVTESFHAFCSEFLWRGLCGRCGLLGDHFTSECPLSDPSIKVFRKLVHQESGFNAAASLQKRRSVMNLVTSMTMNKAASSDAPTTGKMDKKLRQFLLVQHLEWLEPALYNLGIRELDQLPTVDMKKLREELDQISDETYIITEDAKRALSAEAINKFSKALLKQTGDLVSLHVGRSQHFIFLSHFKIEAGTEAALIRNELERMIDKDAGSPANQFSCPIFLDSEDLTNITLLQTRVRQSHNVALLLTKSVLSRPWVLVELATAFEAGVYVVPVLLLRGFDQFLFPDEEFYKSVRDGSLLGQSGCEVLEERGIDRSQVEQAIRATFQRIAVPYSPHRPESIRQSELQSLLKHCRLKRAFLPDKSKLKMASKSIENMSSAISSESL